MTTFTPLSAAIGGALIGLAAVLLMLLTGRLLILAPVAGTLAGYPMSAPAMPASWVIVIAAGLLVGFGTRLASGCTSGHGVCGIARLSTRSIVATVVFMSSAIVVVALTRHVVGG